LIKTPENAAMSIFEAIMLVCFAAAWPFNIYKSYTTRSTKGKSIFFILVVLAGYVSGIIHKILYNADIVLILYILNFSMVSVDLGLYFRNLRLDRVQAH
jgi:hypothetical protein